MRHEFWNLGWTVTTSLPSRFPPAHLPQVRTWTLAPPITTHLCHAGGFNPPTPYLILSKQIRVRHMDSQRILEGDTVGSLVGKRRIKSDPHRTQKPKEPRRECAACGQGPRRRACADSTPPAGGESQGWACAEDARTADRPGSRGWACAEGAPPAGEAHRRSMRKASSQVHQSEAAGGGAGPRRRETALHVREAAAPRSPPPSRRTCRKAWPVAPRACHSCPLPLSAPPLLSELSREPRWPSRPDRRTPAGSSSAAPTALDRGRPRAAAHPRRPPARPYPCPASVLAPHLQPDPRTARPSQCHLLPRVSPGAPAPLLFAPRCRPGLRDWGHLPPLQ